MRRVVFIGFWGEEGEPQTVPVTRVKAYESCQEDEYLWELQAAANSPGRRRRADSRLAGERFLAATATRYSSQRLFLFFQTSILGHRQTPEVANLFGRGQTPAGRSTRPSQAPAGFASCR